MKINIHAGHNAKGKIACGAVGLVDESEEARKIKTHLIYFLKLLGHTVYDCTVDNAKDERANLRQIVEKCNAHTVDLDVSLHLNSGANDKKGNGRTCGTEVLVTANRGIKNDSAKRIRRNFEKAGFTDRGTKIRDDLYVLNWTNAPAILVECFFVDDKDDVKLYEKLGDRKVAQLIAEGIANEKIGTRYKTNQTMNIRRNPSILSRVETKINKNSVLYVLSIDSAGWGKVRQSSGRIAYVRIKSAKKTYCRKAE